MKSFLNRIEGCKEAILAASILSLIPIGIIVVFLNTTKTLGTINYIDTEYKVWIDADYSRTETHSGLDANGDFYTETETDYWSEQCSDINYVFTRNGSVSDISPRTNLVGTVKCEMPDVSSDYVRDIDFNTFTPKKTFGIIVTLNTGDKYESSSIDLYNYFKSNNFDPNTSVIITRTFGSIINVEPAEKTK